MSGNPLVGPDPEATPPPERSTVMVRVNSSVRDDRTAAGSPGSAQSTREPVSRVGSEVRRPQSTTSSYVRPLSQKQPTRFMPASRGTVDVTRAMSASSRGLSSRGIGSSASARALPDWITAMDSRRDEPIHSDESTTTFVACRVVFVLVFSFVIVMFTGVMLESDLVNSGTTARVGGAYDQRCVGTLCLRREFTPSLEVTAQLSATQMLQEFDAVMEYAAAACTAVTETSCADATAMLSSYPSETLTATLLSFVSSTRNCSTGSQFSTSAVPVRYASADGGCVAQFVIGGTNAAALSALRIAAPSTAMSSSIIRANLVAATTTDHTVPRYPSSTSSDVQNVIVDIQFWPVPVFSAARWPDGITTAPVLEGLGMCLICFVWLVALITSSCLLKKATKSVDDCLKALMEAAAIFASREEAENPTLGPTRANGNPMLGSVRLSSAMSGLRSNLSTPSIHPQSRGIPMAPGLGALRSPSSPGLQRLPAMPLVRLGSMQFAEAEAVAKSLQAAMTAVDGIASYVPMALSFGGDAHSGWASSVDFFAAGPVGGGGFQTIGQEGDDDDDENGDGVETAEDQPSTGQSIGLVVFDVQQHGDAEAVRSNPSSAHNSFRNTAAASGHNSFRNGPAFDPPALGSATAAALESTRLGRVPTPENAHLGSDDDGVPVLSPDRPGLTFSPLLKQHSDNRLRYSPKHGQASDATFFRAASGSPKSPRAFPDGVASPPARLIDSSFLGVSMNALPAAVASVAQFQSLRRASALAFTMPMPYEAGSTANAINPVSSHTLRQKLCTVLHCQLLTPNITKNAEGSYSAFMVSMLQTVSHEFHEVTMRIAALFDGIVVSFGVDFVCLSWNGFSPYQFHETRACQCALHIEQGLRSVIESTESWKMLCAGFAMCVATGQAVVGGVSANTTPYPVLCGENIILARRGAELAPILQATTLVLEDTYVVAKSQVAGIPRDTIGTGLNRTVVFELKSTEPVSPRGLHSEYIAAFSKLKQGYFAEAAAALQALIAKAGDHCELAFSYALRVAEYCCENPGEIQMFNQQSGIHATERATLFRRLPTWLIHEIQALELEELSDGSLDRTSSELDTGDRESIEAPSTEPRTSRPAAAPSASELIASPNLQDAVARGLRMSRAREDTAEGVVTISVEDTDPSPTSPVESNIIEIDGERWTRGEKVLGSGANGIVRLAMSSLGSLSAMKFIPLSSLSEDSTKALSEVAILSNLRHESIVGYISSAVVGSDLVVVLEYCGGGTLARLVSLFGALPIAVLQRYARGILRGLNFLHKHGVTHRDLSLGNVLVTIDGECKLSDFGASVTRSTHKPMAMGNVLGTPAFMAPETCLGQVSMMSDVWSFGIMLCWLASGRAPYDENLLEKPIDFLRRLASEPDFGPIIPPEVRQRPLLNSLVESCLQRAVVDRPWAETLLAHPFFLS